MTSEQLAQANKIYSEIVQSLKAAVGTGTWYQPTAGLDQVIYPEQAPSDNTSNGVTSVYYPFYELADSYVAYNPSGAAQLSYSAQVEEDPVDNELSGAVVQGPGLQNVVRNIYSGMVYGLSATDQSTLAGYKQDLNDMYTYISGQLKTSFQNTGDYDIVTSSQNNFFADTDGMTIIESSIIYLLTNMSYYQNSFNSSGNMMAKWKEYFTDADGNVDNEKLNDSGTVNDFVSWGKDYMMQGGISLSDELNPSYGPLVQQGRDRAPAWGNPWTTSIYSDFSDVSTNITDSDGNPETILGMTSTAGQGYNNLQQGVNTNANQLQNIISYLSNYVSLTTPGADTSKINEDAYNAIVQGFTNSPSYAIPYTSTALSGSQTGNNVNFNLTTSGSSSVQTAKTSSSTVDWSTGAQGFGWFWGADASNTGSKTTQQKWSDFDDTSSDLQVTSQWNDVTAKSITPSSSWFLGDAIKQAWESGVVADSADFNGGYAFISPDQANQFVTASLYYIGGIAYGAPTNTIKGQTSTSSGASQSSFESFQQTTTASAGFGWGPFSFGGTTSYSTSSSSSSSSYQETDSTGSFSITNKPLEGLSALEYAGTPSGLIGIQLDSIGTAIEPIEASSSSASSRQRKVKQMFKATGESSEENQFDLSGFHGTLFSSTKGRDYITGGSGKDVIYGLGGRDRIDLGSGRDLVWTGVGRHEVTGGGGPDVMHFRKDTVAKSEKSFTKFLDWSEKDGLAFNRYFSDEVVVQSGKGGENSLLYLDGEKVAKFMGLEADLLQAMVDSAHYSI